MRLATFVKDGGILSCHLCDWKRQQVKEITMELTMRKHLYLAHDRSLVNMEEKKGKFEFQGRRLEADRPMRFGVLS